MDFYDRFIKLCADKGEKPSPVAQKIGIHKTAVSNWKARKTMPTATNLIKLADYFGVSVAYLKGEEEDIAIDGLTITPEERKLLELIKELTEDEVKQARDYLGYIISKRGK